MQTKTFTTGRIRRADYDSTTGYLQLTWDNAQSKAYKSVPAEVFRRLCAAPNPCTYWEDRIAEEYPQTPPTLGPVPTPGAGKPSLADLFKDTGGS